MSASAAPAPRKPRRKRRNRQQIEADFLADLDAGHPLRRSRKLRGLTMQELARRAGVSQLTIRNIERGKHVPMRHIRGKIAKALNIPLENRHLIFGYELYPRRRG